MTVAGRFDGNLMTCRPVMALSSGAVTTRGRQPMVSYSGVQTRMADRDVTVTERLSEQGMTDGRQGQCTCDHAFHHHPIPLD